MVKGLDTFQKYFADYEEQYVLIGGAACDILFESNEVNFRATRDLDMVLIVEALTPEFGEKFWEFIVDGKYRNKATNGSNPQFYRFDKPEDDNFPKMIELFCRSDFKLKNAKGITPIHIDDEVSSLSAILLNDDYYKALLNGKEVRNGLSVLRPEYIILFKAKAYLDLQKRKDLGEKVDSSDIKKHKKDILRIASELMLEKVEEFKDMVDRGALYTKVALQLAFLPENEQTMVYEIIKEKKTKITIEMVMKLRSHSGALTEAMVKRYLSTEPIKKKCYKVPARIVEKYFEGMDPNKVDSIVEHALEAWFSKEDANVRTEEP